MGETEGPPIEELELGERPEEGSEQPRMESVYRDPVSVERLFSEAQPELPPAPPSLEPVDKYTTQSRERMEKASALTDRSLQAYCEELGIDPTTLDGKVVLDVGSGTKELFSKQAAEVGATVFSVNPKLREWKTRRQLQGWIFRDPRWQERSVAARGQELPFRNEAFDLVTSNWAVSYYSMTAEDRFRTISEMARVLKPGGSIRMFPRGTRREASMEEVLGRESVEWLRNNGFTMNEDSDVGPVVITRKIEEKNEQGEELDIEDELAA